LFLHTISVTNVNQHTLSNSVHETSNQTDRHYLTISLWIRFKYSIKELTKGTGLWLHNCSWLSSGFLVLISTSDHKIGCFVQLYVHWKSQSEPGLRSSIIQKLWITKDFVCRIPFSRSGFFFKKIIYHNYQRVIKNSFFCELIFTVTCVSFLKGTNFGFNTS
jgi:hypothetical protein